MKSTTVIAGLLLTATAFAAQAQPPTTVVADSRYVERVAFDPADLTRHSGLRALKARVRGAAHRVCELGIHTPSAEYRERVCFNATLPAALAQVDAASARFARGELAPVGQIVLARR